MLPHCLGLTEVMSGKHLNDPEEWYGRGVLVVCKEYDQSESRVREGRWILAQGKENFEKDS
jgi:hypothetical protein